MNSAAGTEHELQIQMTSLSQQLLCYQMEKEQQDKHHSVIYCIYPTL